MTRKITIVLISILWPISLFFSNTNSDFTRYIIPTIIVAFSLFLYDRKFKYYSLPILAIPVFEPKLAIIPLIYFLVSIFFKKSKQAFVYIILSLAVVFVFWKPFFGQTIFKFDYQAGQQIIQKSNLYHSIPLARTFQNKLRIPLDKFSNNFFSILDPNNYFFGFMPRQILIDNQNLNKFPFIAIVFFLAGLFGINSIKRKDFIIPIIIASIINLSILIAFDRQDFVLFIPILFVIIHGISILETRNKKITNLLLIFTLIFTIPEIIRTIVQSKK